MVAGGGIILIETKFDLKRIEGDVIMTVKEYYVLNSDIKSGNDKIEIYVRGSNSEFGNYIASASYFDLLKMGLADTTVCSFRTTKFV